MIATKKEAKNQNEELYGKNEGFMREKYE